MIIELEHPVLQTDIISVSYTGNDITSVTDKILEQFEDLQIRNTLPRRFVLPATIQAEDWDYQEGLVLEETTDTGGGYNFGYTDAGDFADYRIAIDEAGAFSLSVRVASTNSNGMIRFILIDDFYEEQDDLVIAELNIPNTGGWQSWSSISQTVDLPQGFYKLRLYIVSPEFNVNWFKLEVSSDIEDKSEINQAVPIIYPNPVTGDELFINFDHLSDINYHAEIYSISGKLLYSEKISGSNSPVKINIAHIPEGLAILRLLSNGQIYTYKIIRR